MSFSSILSKIDGNKTKIGVVITGAGAIVENFNPQVGSVIKTVGEVVATGGASHGVFKWLAPLLAKLFAK